MTTLRARPVRPSPVFLGLVAITLAAGALTVVGGQLAVIVGTIGFILVGWVVSLSLHEFGHAIVAYRGGDHSVEARGYLTLDPRRYANIGLTVVVPLLILLIGGIVLPGGAVWINRAALRSRATASAVSLAGPGMNLLLAIVLIVLTGTVAMPVGLLAALSYLALLQCIAVVLNILPVPGLDGFGALEPYLSPSVVRLSNTIRPYGPLVLIVILIGIPGAGATILGWAQVLFDLVGGNPAAAQQGLFTFFQWRF